MKTKTIVLLAAVMGLVTTLLFMQTMRSVDRDNETVAPTAAAVAAAQPIKRNQVIQADMVKTIRIPANAVQPNALRSVNDAVGQVAETDMAAGEMILSHRLKGPKEEAPFVSLKVEEGFRAVSVGVDLVQSVSNLIEPDDRVDVVYTPGGTNAAAERSRLLLSDVRVLAAGRKLTETAEGEPYAEYSTVTLQVRPHEAVPLVDADVKGTITLVLIGRNETTGKEARTGRE